MKFQAAWYQLAAAPITESRCNSFASPPADPRQIWMTFRSLTGRQFADSRNSLLERSTLGTILWHLKHPWAIVPTCARLVESSGDQMIERSGKWRAGLLGRLHIKCCVFYDITTCKISHLFSYTFHLGWRFSARSFVFIDIPGLFREKALSYRPQPSGVGLTSGFPRPDS